MRRCDGFLGRACRAAIGLAAIVLPGSARADEPPKAGTRRALIVCGLPGDDEHRKLLGGTVEKLRAGLVRRCGFDEKEIVVRSSAAEPGAATREGIASAVEELRKRLTPDDTLWVIVLGHGHYDGRHSHINLPGPDPDEREFAKIFEGIKAREQVFWITTSASGFFLKPLSGPGRIVVTATEPDQEVNETLFPLAMADALTTPPEGIDRDKDGQISVLELYLAVVADVMKRYVDAEDLPTEHARLDDNGDGRGREIQEDYLPPELGGRPVPASKSGSAPAPPPPPEIKPGDDGAVAAKSRVGAMSGPKS
jgi:hypothetical protein